MTEPRSIADVIRGMDERELATLLALRPDLAQPRPASIAEVIERASGQVSTALAVDGLDAWQRRICIALAASGPISVRHLVALLGAESAAVEHGVKALRERAMAWGSDRSVQVTQAVRTTFGPYPAGLANTSTSPLSDSEIDTQLRGLDAPALKILTTLAWGSPVGRASNADRVVTLETAATPMEQLRALKLLRPLDHERVILPREVALRLRGGRLFDDVVETSIPSWPAGTETGTQAKISSSAGLGSAVDLVARLTSLIGELERIKPRVLSAGGIAKRDLTQLSAVVGDEAHTRLMLEIAAAAGFVWHSAAVWAPTRLFDQWAELDGFRRWSALRNAWLDLQGWPHQSAGITSGSEPFPARIRRACVAQVSVADLAAPITAEKLAARLAWRHPSWSLADVEKTAATMVDELSLFGLLGMGLRTELLDADQDPGFPALTTTFMIQSDLTAVAPAPLTAEVSRVLELITDRESRGPASTHRFTEQSIRRGLDAGWTQTALSEWLGEHSSTAVPQPLSYLLADVSRRHGQIQVSAAAAVITLADEAALEALMNHRDAQTLGLTKVAPQVVVSLADPTEVVEVLRALGLAPVARGLDGAPMTAPPPKRVRPAHAQPRAPRMHREQFVTLAKSLLSQGQIGQHSQASAELHEQLEQAQATASWLQLNHIDDQGLERTSTVRVLGVGLGQVRVVRRASGALLIPLSRITSVKAV